MAVITISRESGSRGGEVARGLANRMGYHLVDRKIIASLLAQYGLPEFDAVYDATPSFFSRLVARHEDVTTMLNRAVQTLAQHGNSVILGRGSYVVLKDLADVLNVRVQAPLAVRAQRISERQEIGEIAKAEAYAKDRDARRAAFVESSYGVRWDSALGFDLVVDTAKIPAAVAVAMIEQASQAVRNPPAGAKLTRDLEVDPVMASAVSELLGCQRVHGERTLSEHGSEQGASLN